MKLKKLIALTSILAICMATGISASASEGNLQDVSMQTFNEYDYVLALEKSSVQELAQSGLTECDVKEYILQFEAALDARATLTEEELMSLGYAQEEIDLLHAHAQGARLSDAELRAITGTCTGVISQYACSDSTAEFSYSWTWDHCPLVALKDSAAIRWKACDSNAHEIDTLKRPPVTKIDYYQGDTFKFKRDGSLEPGLDFDIVNLQFEVQEPIGPNVSAYAKTGEVKVQIFLDPTVTNKISYVRVVGLYGHTTVGLTFPSVSLSPGESLSISFSANLSIDRIAAKEGILRPL